MLRGLLLAATTSNEGENPPRTRVREVLSTRAAPHCTLRGFNTRKQHLGTEVFPARPPRRLRKEQGIYLRYKGSAPVCCSFRQRAPSPAPGAPCHLPTSIWAFLTRTPTLCSTSAALKQLPCLNSSIVSFFSSMNCNKGWSFIHCLQ